MLRGDGNNGNLNANTKAPIVMSWRLDQRFGCTGFFYFLNMISFPHYQLHNANLQDLPVNGANSKHLASSGKAVGGSDHWSRHKKIPRPLGALFSLSLSSSPVGARGLK